MVNLELLDAITILRASEEAITTELTFGGLKNGVLRIGVLNATPSEYYLLLTDPGHSPLTMVVSSERFEDPARALLVAQDFLTYWKQEIARVPMQGQ